MLVTVVWKPKGTGAAAGLPDRHAAPEHGGSADRHTDVRGSRPQAGDAQEGALTKRAPAPRQPSHSTGGDRSCSGGAPTRRAAVSHLPPSRVTAGLGMLVGRSFQAVISAHTNPASSRAIAVTTTFLESLPAARRRKRPHSRSCAAQARARTTGSRPLWRSRSSSPTAGRCFKAQADSTSWARRWALPHLVMWPRHVEVPLEYSEGTRPQTPVNAAARPNRRQSPTSLARVNAPTG